MGNGVRIGVVGCGAWGSNHVRTWAELGLLGAVCDGDPVRRDAALALARTVAPASAIDGSVDPHEVFARPDIDAVVLATPAATHASLAMAALDAGKDVLVEKPMTLTRDEANDLVARVDAGDRVLMVGHLLEYHPAVEHLAGMVAAGELGPLRYVASHRLNFGTVRTVENVLWSFATHDVSVLLRLAGRPSQVAAHGGAFVTPGVEDVTVLAVDFATGTRGHVFASWLHPFKEHRLVVVGESGMAVFDDREPWASKLVLYPQRVDCDGVVPVARAVDGVPVALDEAAPLRRECEHFVARIGDRAAPRSDVRAGLAVIEVLEAGDRSLRAGGTPVDVKGDA